MALPERAQTRSVHTQNVESRIGLATHPISSRPKSSYEETDRVIRPNSPPEVCWGRAQGFAETGVQELQNGLRGSARLENLNYNAQRPTQLRPYHPSQERFSLQNSEFLLGQQSIAERSIKHLPSAAPKLLQLLSPSLPNIPIL